MIILTTACRGPGNETEAPAGTTPPTATAITDTPAASPPCGRPAAACTPTPVPPPATPTPIPTTGAAPTDNVAAPAEEATATVMPSPIPPTPTNPPVASPVPITVNGMPASEFIIMDDAVLQNARAIYAQGQTLGRNPHAFSKLGDSLVLTSHYLTKFDTGLYALSPEYAYLQPAIDYYRGSFQRYGVAVEVGLHAWAIFDPFWADDEWCVPGEHMLDCEFRLHNPSILLIRMGTNDDGSITDFEENMRLAVETTIANGIIPVLGTKADRFEGDNRNNLAIRRIAADYQVPLWDFDLVADTIPGRGVSEDNVHLTIMYEHDYNDPEAFERGYPVNDLTGLIMLHTLLNQVVLAAD